MNSQAKRTALVTGVSRGLGKLVALELAQRGVTVLAAARRAGEVVQHESLIPVEVDMRDRQAVAQLAPMIARRFGRLDILVGNAGILGERPPLSGHAPASWDEVMAVNLTANFHLIRALDPLIRSAGRARAVFVTSGAAVAPADGWGAYGISKACLNALVITWAREIKGSGAVANLFRPGPVRTDMRAMAMPAEDPSGIPPAEAVAYQLADMCEADFTANGEIWRHGKEGLWR
jgi:NAD(P)-dependent dehydrogenase (short-subunit alcohol dehydrogenase family)